MEGSIKWERDPTFMSVKPLCEIETVIIGKNVFIGEGDDNINISDTIRDLVRKMKAQEEQIIYLEGLVHAMRVENLGRRFDNFLKAVGTDLLMEK